MSFWSWLRNAFTFKGNEPWDQGFMVRDGKSLCWAQARLPVDVIYTESADPFCEIIARWVREVNERTGKKIFLLPSPAYAESGIVKQFELGVPESQEHMRKLIRGIVLIQAVDHYNPRHPGNTDIRYDKRTGEMFNCVVSVPAIRPPMMPFDEVIGHELVGHCTGLDHDGDPTSIIHHKAQFGQRLLDADVQRLRKAYR